MAALQRDVATLEELQRTQADEIVERIVAALPKASKRHGFLSERDFWIAVGAGAFGIALAKLWPAVQQLVQ